MTPRLIWPTNGPIPLVNSTPLLIFCLDLPKSKVDTLNNVYSEAHMSGMKGSVIIEKLRSPELRREWDKNLYRLTKTIKKMNEAKHSLLEDPTGLEYLEAVLAFAERAQGAGQRSKDVIAGSGHDQGGQQEHEQVQEEEAGD